MFYNSVYGLLASLTVILVTLPPSSQYYFKTGTDLITTAPDDYLSALNESQIFDTYLTGNEIFNTAYRKPVTLDLGRSCENRFGLVVPPVSFRNGTLTSGSLYSSSLRLECATVLCNSTDAGNATDVTGNSRDNLKMGQNVGLAAGNQTYIITISFNRFDISYIYYYI